MQPDRKPDSLPCGHCGASTALSWHSDGDGGAMGQGKCSSCGYLVHSFAFNDDLPLDIFLSALPTRGGGVGCDVPSNTSL